MFISREEIKIIKDDIEGLFLLFQGLSKYLGIEVQWPHQQHPLKPTFKNRPAKKHKKGNDQ